MSPTRPVVATVAAIAVVAGLALDGCAEVGERPAASEWTQPWQRAQAVLPAPDQLPFPQDTETCGRVLGDLRGTRDDLFPTPDELLDDLVRNWLATAETAYFECFEPSGQATAARVYADLDRLEDQVTTALGGPGDG